MTNEPETAVAAVEPVAPEIDTSPTPPDPAEPTARGAIDRAFDAVDKMLENGEQPEPAPAKEAKAEEPAKEGEKSADERERNPDGTFKAKEGEDAPTVAKDGEKAEKQAKEPKGAEDDKKATDGFTEPPNRFSTDAKEAWKDAPLSVRAEIRRMEREFGAGLEKYRTDAEAFTEYKDFAAELTQNGQKFSDVVGQYKGIEALLARDPVQGLDTICRNLGTTLADVAAKVTNQTPNETAQQQQNATYDLRQENNELRQEIASLRDDVSGVRTTVTTQAEQQAMSQINDFAQNPSHPRFEELSADISLLLNNRRASNLAEAYTLAERLNPVPLTEAPAPASEAETPAPQAQTLKGQLSPTGAPGSGSNPDNRKVPASARDALDNAFSRVGLG
ncbi:MAG: hypothetical protein GY952_11640 [Rhodobacteraceae bacterium]|nr:hypothetical protein [Paracoccaceae bacterium]